MVKYKAYVKANKRKLVCEIEIGLERAIDFLKETKKGIIEDDDGLQYTLEELKDVKNIRSLPGIGASNLVTSREPVLEDSYRELFESIGDNTEPSTECDNQRD